MTTIAETLAAFGHNLALEHVPQEVRASAARYLADALACAIAAASEQEAETLVAVIGQAF